MKLLRSTKNKIAKDKNGENVPHLEITELVSVLLNIFNNNYQQDLRVLYAFVTNKSFRNEKSFIRNFSNKFHPFKNI